MGARKDLQEKVPDPSKIQSLLAGLKEKRQALRIGMREVDPQDPCH